MIQFCEFTAVPLKSMNIDAESLVLFYLTHKLHLTIFLVENA
jgi:hypothetical protein